MTWPIKVQQIRPLREIINIPLLYFPPTLSHAKREALIIFTACNMSIQCILTLHWLLTYMASRHTPLQNRNMVILPYKGIEELQGSTLSGCSLLCFHNNGHSQVSLIAFQGYHSSSAQSWQNSSPSHISWGVRVAIVKRAHSKAGGR